ncbi:ATP-grasp domain-containing protein [Micromonospora sp. ALFpr18c]|uniref:ATP-grasp domain-containing protein n=1 Tax=Micromonospora sp. ALFpr18c TaxID=1458665 RepID=UPI00124B1AE2|nr:ATP-grasp domain-containing protein [Micromonospora sp. ALFpr18c]KAB1942507.1 ATP-grasp domain-containing protein [Micromonospora sp. ALFpr18c]
MRLDLGRDELVMIGAALDLLRGLGEVLPDGSVVVVEEPDLIRSRDLERHCAALPYVSRVVAAEYQTGLDARCLLAREPTLAAARLVAPGQEYGVLAAAQLADALGLPGAGVDAAETFTDKHRMRLLAATAGLLNPAYALVGTAAEAVAFAERQSGPCVLKPTRRAGSLGVQIVPDATLIAAAWAATADPETPTDATARGLPTAVLAEQVLIGTEHSVELLLADGEVRFANVTDKRVLAGRWPVETGHTVPSVLPDDARRDLIEVACRLAAAAGFRTGVLHSEWIRTADGPALVECAARLPGDLIAGLISLAYECGFVLAYLRTLRGERPALPARPSGAAAIEFLLAAPGTVTAVDGVRAARRVPGVLDVGVAVTVGDEVAEVTSSARRSGQVLAWGADPAEATEAATRAVAQIRITTG